MLLVDLWTEVLERPVGIRDSLAALGATAPQVERLLQRVERATGLSAAVHEWNPPGTIEALAAVLARGGAPAGKRPGVLARHPDGARPPFVFVHGDYNGRGLYCLALAARLGHAQPLYALMPHGIDGVPIPGSIEEMAQDHLVTLRGIQPAGPYRLGGHCNGGLIAFEMARRLEAQGERVALLVLIASDVTSTAAVAPAAPPSGGRLLRYYWRRLRETAGVAPEPAASAGDSRGARAVAERTRAYARRFDAYKRVLMTYRPGPYGGPVVLLWPESQDPQLHPGDPTQGWGAVAQAVEVRPVPGDHLSCVTTHVDVVAAELRRCLDGA